MMDYEHQPANHLSFRLADRVIVPEIFPGEHLRRFGARGAKIVRYDGFKEELYLADLDRARTCSASSGSGATQWSRCSGPPPDGALYHRERNDRFDETLDLPRGAVRGRDRAAAPNRRAARALREPAGDVPERAVDGTALLAAADLVVGGGGTMTRESALLGTPTYTVFLPELAAVDAELIRRGLIVDLREHGRLPAVERKPRAARSEGRERSDAIHASSPRPCATRSAQRAERARGNAGHRLARGDIPRDDGAGTDEGALADPHPTEHHGAGPDRGAALDDGAEQLPVLGVLELSRGRRRRRSLVVHEHDAVPDEDLVPDRDAVADERVALDLAARADHRACAGSPRTCRSRVPSPMWHP